MDLVTTFIRRSSADVVELAHAWDDRSASDNAEGYRADLAAEMATLDHDFVAKATVRVGVDDTHVAHALRGRSLGRSYLAIGEGEFRVFATFVRFVAQSETERAAAERGENIGAVELVTAWDEWCIDDNEDGYLAAVSKGIERYGDEVVEWATVGLALPRAPIERALAPSAVVQARVLGAGHHPVGSVVVDRSLGDTSPRYAIGRGGFLTLDTGDFTPYDSAFPSPSFFDRSRFDLAPA